MQLNPRRDLPLIDALRLVANFGVVFHHMRGGTMFGSAFCVPLFFLLLIAFSSGSQSAEGAAVFGMRKARFLLVPWLRWSLIYIGIGLAADVYQGLAPGENLTWTMLVVGGHESLWFLPVAAVFTFASRIMKPGVERWSALHAGVGLSILAAVYTYLVAGWVELPFRDLPERTWLRMTPALFWGSAIAQSLRARSALERNAILLCCSSLALTLWWLRPEVLQLEDPIPRFGLAVPVACVGFAFAIPVPEWVGRMASCTFAIYLSHLLFAKLLTAVVDPFQWSVWVHAATVWFLSFAGVLTLRALGLKWQELRVVRRAQRTA